MSLYYFIFWILSRCMCPNHLNSFFRLSFKHSSELSLFDQSNEDDDEDNDEMMSRGPEVCPDGIENFKKKDLALIKTY